MSEESDDGGLSTLGEVVVDALEEFLYVLFTPIREIIERYADDLIGIVVGTPAPNAVFSAPSNDPWPGIYQYYWEAIIPLSLTLWAVAIGLVILLESTSHLFGGYHRSKLKRRAFTGLIGILSWWWIAAFSLQLVDELTRFLVPTLSNISLFQTVSFGSIGVLGVVIALSTNFLLFVLIAILYFTRQLILYLFVLLMPLLIALWIPGVGPFALSSKFMKRLAGFYVPFLFMTVPVALLFRLGGLLGESFSLSMGDIGMWLTALVIPLAAVVSPFVLFWQAGALFFLADRASGYSSKRLAKQRVNQTQSVGQTTAQGGSNFISGVRGKPATKSDGQAVLNSGSSQAHAAGERLNQTGTALRDRVANAPGGGTERGGSDEQKQRRSDGGADVGATGGDRDSGDTTDGDDRPPQHDDFENLRNSDRSKSSEKERDETTDEQKPRYIY